MTQLGPNSMYLGANDRHGPQVICRRERCDTRLDLVNDQSGGRPHYADHHLVVRIGQYAEHAFCSFRCLALWARQLEREEKGS